MINGKRITVALPAHHAGKSLEKTGQKRDAVAIPAASTSHTSGGQRK